jgi:hypothetical protein
MGEAGDPCGMPMLIGRWMSVQPSNERAVVLFARNDLTHESTAFGHPSCDMVWSRRADDTLSNAADEGLLVSRQGQMFHYNRHPVFVTSP